MIKVVIIFLFLAWIPIIIEMKNAPTDTELWGEDE